MSQGQLQVTGAVPCLVIASPGSHGQLQIQGALMFSHSWVPARVASYPCPVQSTRGSVKASTLFPRVIRFLTSTVDFSNGSFWTLPVQVIRYLRGRRLVLSPSGSIYLFDPVRPLHSGGLFFGSLRFPDASCFMLRKRHDSVKVIRAALLIR